MKLLSTAIQRLALGISFAALAGVATVAAADPVIAAVEDTSRLEEHRIRDAGRKPAQVLGLIELQPGDAVAELAVGGGYYAALLSRAVGDEGTVYAVDPKPIFAEFPEARKTYARFAQLDPRDNIVYSIQDMDTLRVAEPLDSAMMILYYHDTIWTGEDRAAMNRAIFAALRPGGQFLLVDHHAQPGAPDSVTRELHRMDATQVVPEVTAAGFVLERESDILANPDDPRTASVFDEDWRGKTDRFVYVFRKPRE
ncbi:MAG: SAM-dependent methyltransferase [Pseudomonadota bacterium]